MSTKKCSVCKIDKPLRSFTSKQSKCIICKSKQNKENYIVNKIESRKEIRREFFNFITNMWHEFSGENTYLNDYKYINHFITLDSLNEMKKQSEKYTFLHAPKENVDADKMVNVEFWERKYFIDLVFILDSDTNIGSCVHII